MKKLIGWIFRKRINTNLIIKGYLFEFGKAFGDGIIIDKDCIINLPNEIWLRKEFKDLAIGKGKLSKDVNGILFEGELTSFDLGVGGLVNKREGNIIKDFEIKEVSIIAKNK